MKKFYMYKLKGLKEAKGVDQKVVADALSVDRTTYAKYETGKSEPILERLLQLAEFFDVSLDSLLGFHGKAPDKNEIDMAEFLCLLNQKEKELAVGYIKLLIDLRSGK